jgi:hypothetical protein
MGTQARTASECCGPRRPGAPHTPAPEPRPAQVRMAQRLLLPRRARPPHFATAMPRFSGLLPPLAAYPAPQKP